MAVLNGIVICALIEGQLSIRSEGRQSKLLDAAFCQWSC